jgi:hypothetical protein
MLGPGSRIIIDAVLLDLQNFLNLLDFGIYLRLLSDTFDSRRQVSGLNRVFAKLSRAARFSNFTCDFSRTPSTLGDKSQATLRIALQHPTINTSQKTITVPIASK